MATNPGFSGHGTDPGGHHGLDLRSERMSEVPPSSFFLFFNLIYGHPGAPEVGGDLGGRLARVEEGGDGLAGR